MPTSDDSPYQIEQFRLNPSEFGKLAALIKTAFVQDSTEEGGTIAFNETTFNLMFGSPHTPNDLFLRAIDKATGEIVGFLGGIPRDLSIQGKIYKFGVPSWIAVHAKHQRHGLALQMGFKLLEIGKARGYEGAISFFEPEAHGIDTARAFARQTGLPLREIQTIRKFIIRVFDVARVAKAVKVKWWEKLGLHLLQGVPAVRNPRVRPFRPGDAPRMFDLMQDHVERNELAVLRGREDFIWYLQQPGVNCVVHEAANNQADGFIVAWEMQLAGFGNVVPCGWLDLVHTYRLSLAEATDLVKLLCVTSKGRGWAAVQTPFIPYFNPAPLKKAKFVFFPKQLIVTLIPLVDIPLPAAVKSFYFDWR